MRKLIAITVIALGGLTTVGCSISGPGIGGHVCSGSSEDAALQATEYGRELLEEDPVTGRSRMDVLEDIEENGIYGNVPDGSGGGFHFEEINQEEFEEEYGTGC